MNNSMNTKNSRNVMMPRRSTDSATGSVPGSSVKERLAERASRSSGDDRSGSRGYLGGMPPANSQAPPDTQLSNGDGNLEITLAAGTKVVYSSTYAFQIVIKIYLN